MVNKFAAEDKGISMKQNLFLKQYQYEIPASSITFPLSPKNGNTAPAKQEPALWAFFDFENNSLQLEGDCHFILKANKRFENSWFNYYKSRVFIDVTMKPEAAVNPNDAGNNEMLLFLKGSIYDGQRRGFCSGLLRLHRIWHSSKTQWIIYCNLVDNDLDVFEIKFKLPVFTSLFHKADNN